MRMKEIHTPIIIPLFKGIRKGKAGAIFTRGCRRKGWSRKKGLVGIGKNAYNGSKGRVCFRTSNDQDLKRKEAF